MNISKLIFVISILFPSLALAESSKPMEHQHEKSKRQHVHHLPKLDPNNHSHDAREEIGESDQAPILVRITTNNTTVFDRKVGSYSKFDSVDDMTLLQISFQSKKLETNEVALGVAEVPRTSCDNEVMGRVYIAYDEAEEGKWYSFEKDNSNTLPMAFEDHICKMIR